jgi:hypothetical protein
MAGTTGFEPAISGVTIRCVSPGYTTSPAWGFYPRPWARAKLWAREDSNLWPSGCKPDALPLSYSPLCPRGDSNPRFRIESPVSLAGLDDGDLWVVQESNLRPPA